MKCWAMKKIVMFVMVGLLTANMCGLSAASESIPPTSKFAKISIGMSSNQVIDLIGGPTEMLDKVKFSFNPFSNGNLELTFLYKGEGRVVIDGDKMVTAIEYDPNESGYKKKSD